MKKITSGRNIRRMWVGECSWSMPEMYSTISTEHRCFGTSIIYLQTFPGPFLILTGTVRSW